MDFYIDDEKCTITVEDYNMWDGRDISRVVCEIPKEAFIEMYDKWIKEEK